MSSAVLRRSVAQLFMVGIPGPTLDAETRAFLEEYAPGGIFAKLNRWLDDNAARHGFFRPYAVFRGGFRPEPWHLSYAPVAEIAQQQFSSELLQQTLDAGQMDAVDAVRRRLPQIMERYVRNIDAPPASIAGAAIRGTRLA